METNCVVGTVGGKLFNASGNLYLARKQLKVESYGAEY